MDEEKRVSWSEESGTERGRSPRGVPEPGGSPEEMSWIPGSAEGTEGTGVSPRQVPVKGRKLVAGDEAERAFRPEERLLLLDTWRRSKLPAKDFAVLVGVSPRTLNAWKLRFKSYGPEGLLDEVRGAPKGSRVSEVTKRAIVMLKEANPEWGCQRISDMLVRGPALPASADVVGRVLKDAGYVFEEVPTRPHPEVVHNFERSIANQLWQTDLFTFMLKRQNRRVYMVAFMDDHSRFIVSYGVHASQSGALVLEVFRSGIDSWGCPEEVLTDNGAQYVTWRGKSAFAKECEKRGIRHIVARPRRPQTLGKTERFWGSLWRECVGAAVFLDLGDAQKRIGWYIDYYNFQRPHQGIDGAVPADRFFGAAPEVLKTLKTQVAENALKLAKDGVPRKPFYVTGQVGGKTFSVHAEGERVIMMQPGAERQEVELVGPEVSVEEEEACDPGPGVITPQGKVEGTEEEGNEEPNPPGVSDLDQGLEVIGEILEARKEGVDG